MKRVASDSKQGIIDVVWLRGGGVTRTGLTMLVRNPALLSRYVSGLRGGTYNEV